MRDYESYPIAPMRLRGVFGITWKIYCRGLWKMLVLAFVYIGVVTLINGLLGVSPERFADAVMNGRTQVVWEMLSMNGLTTLLSLLSLLLLMPLWTAGSYTEYELHMRGKGSELGELFRLSGKNLGRYYGTYWANFLVGLCVGIVLGLILLFVMVGAMGAALFGSIARMSFDASAFVLPVVVVTVIALIVLLVFQTFLRFVYPTVAHEDIRGFRAIGRSFRLAAKRFWRVLGVTVLTDVIFIVIGLVLMLPAIIPLFAAMGNITNVGLWRTVIVLLSFYPAVISLVLTLFETPYLAAQDTVLYMDAIAREPKDAQPNGVTGTNPVVPPAAPQAPLSAPQEPVSKAERLGFENVYPPAAPKAPLSAPERLGFENVYPPAQAEAPARTEMPAQTEAPARTEAPAPEENPAPEGFELIYRRGEENEPKEEP